jgi:hypothetical protein
MHEMNEQYLSIGVPTMPHRCVHSFKFNVTSIPKSRTASLHR